MDSEEEHREDEERNLGPLPSISQRQLMEMLNQQSVSGHAQFRMQQHDDGGLSPHILIAADLPTGMDQLDD